MADKTTTDRTCMTFDATADDLAGDTMTLLAADDSRAVVCFDGDTSDTAVMPLGTLEKLTTGECWTAAEEDTTVEPAAVENAVARLEEVRQ